MDLFFALFLSVIRTLVYAYDLCLFIRAIMSWIPDSADNSFGDLIFTVTEPLVGFIRENFVLRIRALRDLPFDLSLFFACILLGIIIMFL